MRSRLEDISSSYEFKRRGRSYSLQVPDMPKVYPRKVVDRKLRALKAESLDLEFPTGPTRNCQNGDISNRKNLYSGGRRFSLAEHFSTPLARRKSTLKRRKPKRSRLIQKDGECNVYNTNVPKLGQKYLRDIFTTLIDVKWRWILICFSVFFMLSWLSFAVVYYIICYFHGDIARYAAQRAQLSAENYHGQYYLTREQYQILSNDTWEPCVAEIHSFLAAFLFSVETQHTIGYGTRHVTTACPTAGMTVCLQSLCGLVIQSLLVGLVFSKMARPKKRAETLIFSEKAVISLRDSQLCLLIRVADMRMTHLVESHIRVQLITSRTTEEGEVEPLYQHDMDVGYDEGRDRIFLVWPITVCHVINKESPLYDLSQRDLLSAQFEIVVILEGIVESTGMTAQARTSYLPSEILWGHRFAKLVTFQKYNGSYQIDYSLFHNTYPVNTPRCSARDLTEMKRAGFHLGCDSEFFHKNASERDFLDHSDEALTPAVTPTPSDCSNTIYPTSPLPSPDPRSIQNSPTPHSSIKEETNSYSSTTANDTIDGDEDKEEKSLLLGTEASSLNPLKALHTRIPLHHNGSVTDSSTSGIHNHTKLRTPKKLPTANGCAVPQIIVNSPTSSGGIFQKQHSPLIEKTKHFFAKSFTNHSLSSGGGGSRPVSSLSGIGSDSTEDPESEVIPLDISV